MFLKESFSDYYFYIGVLLFVSCTFSCSILHFMYILSFSDCLFLPLFIFVVVAVCVDIYVYYLWHSVLNFDSVYVLVNFSHLILLNPLFAWIPTINHLVLFSLIIITAIFRASNTSYTGKTN